MNALIRSHITCFWIFENALKATWIFRYEKYYITTIIRFQFQPFKYVFAISFAYLHFLKSSYSPFLYVFTRFNTLFLPHSHHHQVEWNDTYIPYIACYFFIFWRLCWFEKCRYMNNYANHIFKIAIKSIKAYIYTK